MKALLEDEIILMAEWDADKSHGLPNNTSLLTLIVNAINPSSGFLAVEYYFKNSIDC